MAFHTVEYNAHFFLGDPSTPPIWRWSVWQRLLPALDPLMNAARDKPAVRSLQYLPSHGGQVKFGRIVWNIAGHQKWAHGSPTNAAQSPSWDFRHLEAWAPGWNQCARENLAPDVFLSICNEKMRVAHQEAPSFNPLVILAVASQLAEREPAVVGAAVKGIIRTLKPLLVGYRRRPWGRTCTIGFDSALQDFRSGDLFKGRNVHQGPVDAIQIEEGWQILSY